MSPAHIPPIIGTCSARRFRLSDLRGVLLALLFLGPYSPAQSVPELEALHTGYADHKTTIEASAETARKDVLRKYMMALMNQELALQDEGRLEDLLVLREYRDRLMLSQTLPSSVDEAPASAAGLTELLLKETQRLDGVTQTQLQTLNAQYDVALERHQVAFTRAGNLEAAIAIREIRERLKSGLPAQGSTPGATESATHLLCYESPSLQAAANGPLRRVSSVPVVWTLDEGLTEGGRGLRFRNGSGELAGAGSALLEACRRSNMLTLELALTPTPTRHPREPQPLLTFGNQLENCNFALTWEGFNLVLRVKTSRMPGAATVNYVPIGRIPFDRTTHLVISYQSGDLQVFRDGLPFFQSRDVQGGFADWSELPLRVGKLGDEEQVSSWRGTVHALYVKPANTSKAQAESDFTRFRRVYSAGDVPSSP